MIIGMHTYPHKFLTKPPRSASVYGAIGNHFKFLNEKVFVDGVQGVVEAIRNNGAIHPIVSDATGFKGAQIIAVDFDNKGRTKLDCYNSDDVLDFAKRNGITPNIVFKSLSCSTRKVDRFRFVYVFDGIIVDENDYDAFSDAITLLFGDFCDDGAKGKKWFLTGKRTTDEIIFINENITEIGYIQKHLSWLIQSCAKSKNYVSKNIPKPKVKYTDDNKPITVDVGIDDIRSSCKLFDQLCDGTRMDHEEKMLLSSSLNYVKNGRNHFIEQVTKKSKNIGKWSDQMAYFDEHSYRPIRCKDRCVHHSTCGAVSMYNKISCFHTTRSNGSHNKNAIEPSLMLDMFVNDLSDIVRSTNEDNGIYILKVPAGLGKTETLLKRFIGYGVIAFPNHSLKDEKIIDYENIHNKSPKTTLNIKDFVTDKTDLQTISDAFTIGDTITPKNIISGYDEGLTYLQMNGMPLSSVILTTHEKTLRSTYEESVNNIFYDEDPINTLFTLRSHSDLYDDIKYLSKVKKELGLSDRNIEFLFKFERVISSYTIPVKITLDKHQRQHVKTISEKMKKAYKAGFQFKLSNNIPELIGASVFNDKTYSFVNELPEKRIFILSATPDIDFYRKMYPNRTVKAIDYDNVLRKGSIRHVLLPTSKKALEKEETIDKIRELSEDSQVITFKKFNHLFNTEDSPWGGNVLGFNSCIGKSLTIAYTFQKPNVYYAHRVANQGHVLGNNWTSLSYKRMFHGGNTFMFSLFNDPEMAKYQIQSIESEMYQATERARLIRNDVEVLILSSFIPSFINKYR